MVDIAVVSPQLLRPALDLQGLAVWICHLLTEDRIAEDRVSVDTFVLLITYQYSTAGEKWKGGYLYHLPK